MKTVAALLFAASLSGQVIYREYPKPQIEQDPSEWMRDWHPLVSRTTGRTGTRTSIDDVTFKLGLDLKSDKQTYTPSDTVMLTATVKAEDREHMTDVEKEANLFLSGKSPANTVPASSCGCGLRNRTIQRGTSVEIGISPIPPLAEGFPHVWNLTVRASGDEIVAKSATQVVVEISARKLFQNVNSGRFRIYRLWWTDGALAPAGTIRACPRRCFVRAERESNATDVELVAPIEGERF